jgi:hypothetical protein
MKIIDNRKSIMLIALVAMALAVLLVLLAVHPALAAPDPSGGDGKTSQIGTNLGNEVRSWAKALLLGVAALVGLPALAKRDLSQSLVIAVIVLVVGGFIFADGTVKTVIQSLWSTIGQ